MKTNLHCGADCCGIEAGGAWDAGFGSDPAGGDLGIDVLPVEEAVRKDAFGQHTGLNDGLAPGL